MLAFTASLLLKVNEMDKMTQDELQQIEASNEAHAAEVAYYALIALLKGIERRTGAYLVDENVDRENVNEHAKPGTAEFWYAMAANASMAAGYRAEDADLDLNVLAGRIIY